MATNDDNMMENNNNNTNPQKNKGRGFAGMDPERQREIASEGGKAAHEKGTAHEFNSDEARRAGQNSHKNRNSNQESNRDNERDNEGGQM